MALPKKGLMNMTVENHIEGTNLPLKGSSLFFSAQTLLHQIFRILKSIICLPAVSAF